LVKGDFLPGGRGAAEVSEKSEAVEARIANRSRHW
jgi:hypothetical protein